MADFCKCGSLVINERCTNKNCSIRGTDKPPLKVVAAKKSSKEENAAAKSKKTKRASKCITYNLYDEPQSEEGSN